MSNNVEINNMSWIWLDKDKYPRLQKTFTNIMADKNGYNYCVAEFKKTIVCAGKPVKADIKVSGDTFFRVFLNGSILGVGPVCAGGDFLLEGPLSAHYVNNYKAEPDSDKLEFFVQVQLSPVVLTDYSQGHGGFMLSCILFYEDGTTSSFGTDNTWLSRVNHKFTRPYEYDNLRSADEWLPSVLTSDIWPLEDAGIPMLTETPVSPAEGSVIEIAGMSERTESAVFDKIYAGYVVLDIDTDDELDIELTCFEIPGQGGTSEHVITKESLHYRSFQLHSIGGYMLHIKNKSVNPASVRPSLIFTCYPVNNEGSFECSDTELTKVYDVCKWTLRICRQTIHLDSPRHQELLACTGDYYIESLMEAMCFGDMRLAEADILRTAKNLIQNDGRMFHTTYSLIWVQMLKDVYIFTGNKKLIESCMDAIHILLNRFNGYIGETGIIENAPDYMFVDWMVADGYSLHHPPKALGQTCLNAFYYGALCTASELCGIAGDICHSELCSKRAETLKKAHNDKLFDSNKGIYFDGLNSETAESKWLPKNSGKRYYSKHANTLSVLYGLCDRDSGRIIMEKIINNDELTDVQPYFMHFVIEALKKVGLFEKYGIAMLDRYKPMIAICDKGLQEGWHKPEETYSFDHSHAWGGTPAYQLSAAILGLNILEPGFKRIKLEPKLFGLEWAKLTVPTPFGYIRCSIEKGIDPVVEVPEVIVLVK